jgi:hypothetical protein
MLRQGDSWAFARLIGFTDPDQPDATPAYDSRLPTFSLVRLRHRVLAYHPYAFPTKLRDPPKWPDWRRGIVTHPIR